MTPGPVRLGDFDNSSFDRGRSRWFEMLWIVCQALFVASWLPGSRLRAVVLRAFGARIGRGVVFKPGLKVKFPWRLTVADHAWIGEDAWIDNLAPVDIGANVCISQGAYLCTGSHDWCAPTFGLIVKPITIEDGAWIAAHAVVGPGVTVRAGAVLSLAACATSELQAWTIYRGNPASACGKRTIGSGVGEGCARET